MTGIELYHAIFRRISPHFRRKRIRSFLKAIRPGPDQKILDVGGYPGNWREVPIEAEIVTLNLKVVPGSEEIDRRCKPVVGDATDLPYADGSFDVVFSNSVIEHLGTWPRQQRFAIEARRVGRKLWIQTPARIFPVEPHYLAPFIHWLPRRIRRRLIRNFTLFGWLHRPTDEQIESLLDEIRLLSKRELQALFPDCAIIVEGWFGFPKSYIAMRK
jgi:ubiquinone/menaquinone biosynthesis C-methylase UbiE